MLIRVRFNYDYTCTVTYVVDFLLLSLKAMYQKLLISLVCLFSYFSVHLW